jgi:flavin reductase (DIM6/NTAB) family NADH-FMN oxidoreductase RutF
VSSLAVAEPTPEEFRDVIGRFASGVTVISTVDGGEAFATTASAVSSVCLEPPTLLVCMNRASTTGQAIARSRAFAVNVLAEHQHELAGHFATKDPDKFARVEARTSTHGQPLLPEALAHIECRVVDELVAGTHVVFLGRVVALAAEEGMPLAYFRGRFGRLALDGEG